jgi:hypothetical protein
LSGNKIYHVSFQGKSRKTRNKTESGAFLICIACPEKRHSFAISVIGLVWEVLFLPHDSKGGNGNESLCGKFRLRHLHECRAVQVAGENFEMMKNSVWLAYGISR